MKNNVPKPIAPAAKGPVFVESRSGPRLRPIAAHEAAWLEGVIAYGPDHPALVSTDDIAAALGVRPQTVRLWRMRGELPLPVIVRGRMRHLRREVQAWMLANGRNASRLDVPPLITKR